MKKLLPFLFFIILCKAQKIELTKYSTLGIEKANGLDINISYPSDWIKTGGERPHIIFNFKNSDKKIYSTFLIQNIFEGLSKEESMAIIELKKIMSDSEIETLILEQFSPSGEDCGKLFKEQNVNNVRCEKTKIEGINTVFTSGYTKHERANLKINTYMVSYCMLYKMNIINVSFFYHDLDKTDKSRLLANLLASKIMNTVIINDKWKNNK